MNFTISTQITETKATKLQYTRSIEFIGTNWNRFLTGAKYKASASITRVIPIIKVIRLFLVFNPVINESVFDLLVNVSKMFEKMSVLNTNVRVMGSVYPLSMEKYMTTIKPKVIANPCTMLTDSSHHVKKVVDNFLGFCVITSFSIGSFSKAMLHVGPMTSSKKMT